MLGIETGAKEGGAVVPVDKEGDELREKLRVVVRERDEALRLLAEVRNVMCMAGGGAAAAVGWVLCGYDCRRGSIRFSNWITAD
jgi:hypothetical protein